MVQRKIISIAVLVFYILISTITIVYLYHFTEFTEWIDLISLLTFGGVLMLNGLGHIIKMLSEPKLKIENPIVKHQDVDTKHEFKNILFHIRNKGKIKAKNCMAEIKVKGIWDENEVLFSDVDIVPNHPETIRLCSVDKTSHAVALNTKTYKHSGLDKGKKYQLEIQIYGDNFEDKKVYRLELDLSSWENIGIILDC